MSNLQIEQNKLKESLKKLDYEKKQAQKLLRLSVKLPKVQAVYRTTIKNYIDYLGQKAF